MARASWKYHFFKNFEIEQYTNNFLEESYNLNVKSNNRNSTIHKLNYFLPVNLHTGKWVIKPTLTKLHVGFKLGQLTKTRKPYYFRSKKK